MKASLLTRKNSFFPSIFLLTCNYFILSYFFPDRISLPFPSTIDYTRASHWNIFSFTSRNRDRWSRRCAWVLLLVYNKTVIFIWQILIPIQQNRIAYSFILSLFRMAAQLPCVMPLNQQFYKKLCFSQNLWKVLPFHCSNKKTPSNSI